MSHEETTIPQMTVHVTSLWIYCLKFNNFKYFKIQCMIWGLVNSESFLNIHDTLTSVIHKYYI